MELVIILVIALAGFGIFFFVLKRLLRLALRLAMVGAVTFALVVGAVAWWWYAPLDKARDAVKRQRNSNAKTRPARAR